MFQFSGFASFRMTSLQLAGLSHSEICGSIRMCQSPQLIAACRVLHRLWEPRHSPYALNNFLITIFSIKLWCQRTFDILLISMWRISESNRWPPACKAGALASWANPPSLLLFDLSQNKLWACVDSNHGPLHYQCSALTTWATGPVEYQKIIEKKERLERFYSI